MKNYGKFGGQYVPQELKKSLDEIATYFKSAKKDKEFKEEYLKYLKDYVGRPTPLYFAKRLTEYCGGAKIYLKREDLNHTGAHKINNALGQILLAKRMGKTHIIAETGAGQHGVATATVCALFNIKCTIFMGDVDIKRQKVNVEKMKMLGATIKPVKGTLKEAVDEAFNYQKNHKDAYYLVGSAVGPYPYPEIVKYFQSVISKEAKQQILKQENKLPKALIACVGGGSNSIGFFSNFIKYKDIEMYGIEAAGKGIETGLHASAISNNKIGIMHGMKTYLMLDEKNNIKEAYSISAGLDYPGVGPEHAFLNFDGRVKYDSITDEEAIEAFKILTNLEGIIPALESSHAIAYALKIAKNYSKNDSIIVNLSGRGDKDLNTIMEYLESIKFSYYNPSDEHGNCILRTLTKLLNKDYNEVKKDINSLAKILNYNTYSEEEVFTKYLNKYGYEEIKFSKTILNNLKLNNGKYAVIVGKDDFCHMLPIIDNVIYDKKDTYRDMEVIKIYKKINKDTKFNV